METITDRLNRRSLELNVSQADIIRATGAGRGTVSGWFSGANAPSAKYLESLAFALKTSTTWLLSGKDDDINSRAEPSIDISPIATVGYAPVISWVQAGSWTDMESISNLNECEKLPLVPGAGKRSFYLSVRGLSNAPHFEEGEKICRN